VDNETSAGHRRGFFVLAALSRHHHISCGIVFLIRLAQDVGALFLVLRDIAHRDEIKACFARFQGSSLVLAVTEEGPRSSHLLCLQQMGVIFVSMNWNMYET
jgi:hypothetical protein